MKVLVISSDLPNQIEPSKGLYNLELLKYQAKFNEIRAISPIAFPSQILNTFKSILKMRAVDCNIKDQIPFTDLIEGISISYPHMLFKSKTKTKRSAGFFLFLRLLPTLIEIRKTYKFDLIHALSPFPEGFAGVLLSKIFGVPIVITHSSDEIVSSTKKNMLPEKIDRYVVANSTRNIVGSKAIKEKFVSAYNMNNNFVKVIYKGADILKFFPRDKIKSRNQLGLPLNKQILLFLGDLEPRSGINYLIDAIEILYVKNKDICLYIVGDGKLSHAIQRKIKKLYLENQILLRAEYNRNDVPLWLSAVDLVIVPNLSADIQSKVVQSLACGTPVITNDEEGIKEIIPSQDLGLITNPRDCHNLAAKINMGLSKIWNPYELVTRARSFSLHKIAGEIQQCYETLS